MIEINVEIPEREVIESTVTINAKPVITSVTASVDNNVGTPNVIVTQTGTNTEFSFDLAFENLKGDTGDQGEDGVSVTGVSLISTVGVEKTYRMTFSDGTYFDYVIVDGGTVDQTYNPTSANAQSGVAIAGAGFVTTNTNQNISGYKNFTNGFVTSGITCNNSTFTIGVNNKLLMGCSSSDINIGNGARTITFLPPSGQTRPYWGSSNNTLALSSDIPSTANFVNKAGDIMSGDLTIAKSKPVLYLKDTSQTAGITPDLQRLNRIVFYDNADNTLGYIQNEYNTNGTRNLRFNVRNGNQSQNTNLIIGYNTDDNPYCQFPNTTCVDGQWVSSNSNLVTSSSSTALPTTDDLTYDLSTYLPADASTYDYEVAVDGVVYSGSTSGNRSFLVLQGIFKEQICATIARSNVSYREGGFGLLPISHTDRTLTIVKDANNTGTFSLNLRGYRRLGTNQ